MGTFSYTLKKRFSMGNRIAILYELTDVQTSGSIVHTPFKKAWPPIFETTSDTTPITYSTISVADGDGTCSQISLVSDNADADGYMLVTGLL